MRESHHAPITLSARTHFLESFKSSGPRRLAQQFGAPQKGLKCPLTVREAVRTVLSFNAAQSLGSEAILSLVTFSLLRT